MKVSANFQIKILIFKVPVIFENENFAAHATRVGAAEIADFFKLSS